MITPEEAERLAYIKGDTNTANLLAIAIDLQAELEDTQDKLFDAEDLRGNEE
jgi:hypothetical protein